MSLKQRLMRAKQRMLTAWRSEKDGKIGVGRATAAIFGALFLSLAINVVMSVFLPLPTNNRLALASVLMIPIWVALAFYCLLMRNAWVAWALTLGLGSLLLALTILIGF